MAIMPEDFTSASLITSVYRALGKDEEMIPAAKKGRGGLRALARNESG
jgi:hypothetical protein